MQRESTTVIILGCGYLRFSSLSSDKISELFTINTSLHLENYKQSLASTPNWSQDPSGEDWVTRGAIHSTKLSGNFGPKLSGSVRSNRKSFEKTGPPFEVVLFSRSDRLEFWLNGSRPRRICQPFIQLTVFS